MEAYLSIAKPKEILFKEKGSKFYAHAFFVTSEAEIKKALAQCQEKYPAAGHHCYGYRIHPTAPVEKYSDDGEPNGTAGRPIFGQILSKEVYNVLVVVSRIFGGTKLGTGGLVAAYKAAAAEVLEEVSIVSVELTNYYLLKCPSEVAYKAHQLASRFQLSVVENYFEKQDNFLALQVPVKQNAHFQEALKQYENREIKIIKTTLSDV